MPSLPQQDGLYGAFRLSTDTTEYNQKVYLVERLLAQVNVATLVQVVATHTTGIAGPVGTVDVLPLVNLIDGVGAPTRHATVFGLPYIRLQGGAAAFICDPQPGDIGLCIFADSDISAVKASRSANVPGSRRKFSMSDGIYLGGWNSGTAPAKYVLVDANGCAIKGNTSVDGNVDVTGVYKVAGTQVVGNQQAHITGPAGGTTIDVQARTAITSILSLLSTHGLMA